MPDIVITKAGGQVDRYPLPEELTYGEARVIKSITGLMPGEFDSALEQGDAGFIVALAVISGARTGNAPDPDELDGLAFGAITVEDDPDRPTEPAADDDAPPNQPTPDNGGNPS